MYKAIFKRCFDFSASFTGLIVLSPILIITTIILIISNNGKPFFFQERPGKDERIFKLIKFKTMNDKKDTKGKLLPDNLRQTQIGKIIRSFSIDELPQFINVIKGDMSLIGPRPLLKKYLPFYNKEQKRRHEVKPGITGWAQVNGRNLISWEEKFKMDVYYVEKLSFKLDLKILILTLLKILKREGINTNNIDTMKPFKG